MTNPTQATESKATRKRAPGQPKGAKVQKLTENDRQTVKQAEPKAAKKAVPAKAAKKPTPAAQSV